MAPDRPHTSGRQVNALCLLIAVATLAGVVLRLTFALSYWVNKPLTHDEVEYLALARSLATGQGFRYPPAEPGADLERFGRAPLYPVLLSRIGGQAILDPEPSSVPRSVKIGQSFIGAAAIPVLAAIAWRAAGPSAGAIAAILAAAAPSLILMCSYALSESLYSTLAWITVLLLGLAIDRRSPLPDSRAAALTFAAGTVGGLAALTRPAMIMFLGLSAVWLAVRRPPRLALVFALAAAVTITPWTIRNGREYGRFVLIASEGGITFWTGNHPLATGEGDMAANPRIKNANLEFRRQHPGMSSEALEPLYYREALAHIIRHPLWWIGLLGRKLFGLIVPLGPSYALHSTRYRLASVLSYVALLPFAIGGARRLWRAHAPVSALWLIFASAILTCLVFFPQERFRIVQIDPTLVVWAGVGLSGALPRRDPIARRV